MFRVQACIRVPPCAQGVLSGMSEYHLLSHCCHTLPAVSAWGSAMPVTPQMLGRVLTSPSAC